MMNKLQFKKGGTYLNGAKLNGIRDLSFDGGVGKVSTVKLEIPVNLVGFDVGKTKRFKFKDES